MIDHFFAGMETMHIREVDRIFGHADVGRRVDRDD